MTSQLILTSLYGVDPHMASQNESSITMTRQKEWCGDIIEISLQVEKCQIWWPYSVATNVEICGHIFVNKMVEAMGGIG